MAERPSHSPTPGPRDPSGPSRTPPRGAGQDGQPRQPARPAARPLDRPADASVQAEGRASPSHPGQPHQQYQQQPAHQAHQPVTASGADPTLAALIAMLEHEPALGLAIVDEQGRTISSNRRFMALTVPAGAAPGATASDRAKPAAASGQAAGQAPGPAAQSTAQPTGQPTGQPTAHHRATSTARRGVWARVGAEAVRTAASEGHPVVVHFIHEGRQVQCDIWPLPAAREPAGRAEAGRADGAARGEASFLVIAVEGHCGPDSDPAQGPGQQAGRQPSHQPAHESGHQSGHQSGQAAAHQPALGEVQPGAHGPGVASGQRFTTLAPLMAELGALSALTARELEVLALIGQGMATREIAEALGRSPRTVERHCDAIHKKLHTSNRVQMARYAMRAGLTPEAGKLKRV